MLICHIHLFPSFSKRNCIYPFIGSRTAMVIKVIIHTIAAFSILVLLRWKRTHISKVIIAEHNGYVI